MKITTITCEHTRQVRQFEPVKFAITAQLSEGEDPISCAKELDRLTLMVIYKDDPKQRDFLIAKLVDCTNPAVEPKTPEKPVAQKTNFTNF